MEFEQIASLIGSYGFPIVCCGYMMVTMNKTMKENTESTNKLASLMDRLLDKLALKDDLK